MYTHVCHIPTKNLDKNLEHILSSFDFLVLSVAFCKAILTPFTIAHSILAQLRSEFIIDYTFLWHAASSPV